MDIKLNMDHELLIREAQERFTREMKAKADALIQKKLMILFADKHNSVNYIQNQHSNDPDFGYCFKEIQNQLTEQCLGDKFKEYAKKYIENHYQDHLDNALNRAMEHTANKQAFKLIKSKEKS